MPSTLFLGRDDQGGDADKEAQHRHHQPRHENGWFVDFCTVSGWDSGTTSMSPRAALDRIRAQSVRVRKRVCYAQLV